MTRLEEVSLTDRLPVDLLVHGEHTAELRHREGEEGLEEQRTIGGDLEGYVEDRPGALGVCLDHLPRLEVGEVLIAQSGQLHGGTLSIAEVEVLQQSGGFLADFLHLAEHLPVLVRQLGGGHLSVKVFPRQHHCAIDEVAEDGHQLAIVAGLEVLPREVVVLRLRGVGGQHIAQDVLLAGEVLEVLIEPDGPVLGGRDLVSLEIEKLIGGHIVGEDKGALSLEHGGEDDAVEDDIVLPDKVDQPRRGVLPPGLPAVGEQLAGIGDVADRGVKPDVQHLPLRTLDRHGDAPGEVAAHGARLQPHVEPALALTIDVGAPLLVLLEDPLGEPVLIVIEREVPMGSRTLHRGGAAQLGVRVDQLVRTQLRATLLALIAIRLLVAAAGAGANDVSVGEELSRLLIVVLLGRLLDKLSLIIQLAEKGGCRLLVGLG